MSISLIIYSYSVHDTVISINLSHIKFFDIDIDIIYYKKINKIDRVVKSDITIV